MSFDRRRFPLSIFRLPAALPKDALARFAAKAANKIDLIKGGEPATGWVSGRHLLELQIDEDTAIRSGCLNVHLRTAQRKVPRAMLQAECRMLELEYLRENRTDFVPRKVRREIRDQVEQTRLPQMVPQLSAIPVLIEPESRLLFAGTTSAKGADLLMTWIHDTLGLVPAQLEPGEMAARLARIEPDRLPAISFAPDGKAPLSQPGRDFLTWLWFHAETDDGEVATEADGTFTVAVDGPLTLAYADDAPGAAETTVRKGVPMRSAEAKAALAVGKKLRRARLLVARGNETWAMTMDADRFAFGGFAVPEGENLDPGAAFEEKVRALRTFVTMLEAAFALFVERFNGAKREAERKRIRAWSAERESR